MANVPLGRFIWYEMMSTDPDGAEDFYTKVVGWGTQVWNEGPKPYTMWTMGEQPVGGLMELPQEAVAQGAPPHWMPYISTPDTDATLEQAKRLGGSAMTEPMDIPAVGRFVVLADPQGAIFAIYTPESDTPDEDDPPGVGRFSWHELLTTDYEEAFDFYSALFGWEKGTAMDMGEAGMYQMYGRNGGDLGGMYNLLPDVTVPPHWLLYVMVPDVDAAAETVTALGGKILNGPMDVPGGDRIVQCLDPQGAVFALHSKGAGSE